MKSITFQVLPAPPILRNDVECIRVAEYTGDQGLAIQVCLNGLPGIIFQHHHGHSPIESIVTPEGASSYIPALYAYGQSTCPGIMKHKNMPYTMTQVVLKPHALHSLLGINASGITNRIVKLEEFSAGGLEDRLLDSSDPQRQIKLLTEFLICKLEQARMRDYLIEESLHLIHKNSVSITIRHLLDSLNISERQFARRFSQTVGVTPHFYIRVKRFNEAIRLMKAAHFQTLTDIAHALNFHDQSHFIRDFKAFSGTTPKRLSQKVTDFDFEQPVFDYP
jgi:AraC-like DNA-binding protein